jgi:hypothetical protein
MLRLSVRSRDQFQESANELTHDIHQLSGLRSSAAPLADSHRGAIPRVPNREDFDKPTAIIRSTTLRPFTDGEAMRAGVIVSHAPRRGCYDCAEGPRSSIG